MRLEKLEPGNENTQYGLYAERLRRKDRIPGIKLSHTLFVLHTETEL